MAVDYWNKHWIVQIQNGVEQQTMDRVRRAQMGDGYAQKTPEGVNAQWLEIPIVYTGLDAVTVREFLKKHITLPFAFTPPHGELGLYQVKENTIKYTPLNNKMGTVTCTLETSFGYIL